MKKYQKSSQPTQDKIPRSQPNFQPSAPRSQPNYQPSAPRSQPNYQPSAPKPQPNYQPSAPRSQPTTFPNMYEEIQPRQVPSSQTKQKEVPLKYQGEAKSLKKDGQYVIPDKYKGQGV